MKIIQKTSLMFAILILCGCTPMAERVMPPIQYNKPIQLHVTKNAYLNWEVGEQGSYVDEGVSAPNNGIVGAVIGVAIQAELKNHYSDAITYKYGKAQQAVFMTSLKNTLEKNHVFKHVELSMAQHYEQSNDVAITVYFKKTRVSMQQVIMLDTDLIIKMHGKPVFKRTYLVESNPGDGLFNNKDFVEQQTDVSQQLLGKIITGINEWYKQSISRS